MEEGQQQLRREDVERETKVRQLPLESSPYLRHTDLEDYSLVGPATVEWQLSPEGGGATTTTTSTAFTGGRFSPKQADSIDRKLK